MWDRRLKLKRERVVSFASSFYKFRRKSKDKPLSLVVVTQEDSMKQIPMKQVVVAGPKTYIIVGGQVLTSKEAKEARASQ